MRILGIGNATLDIVNLVEEAPKEDTEVRALSQRLTRGGNVTNTLVVLSRLGHGCSWSGVISDDPASRIILDDLACNSVDTTYAVQSSSGMTPTSYICLSRSSGSRTIVHHRDLPEYGAESFMVIDLTPFQWVHFEGRNLPALKQMLLHIGAKHPQLRTSIEIEKPRPGIEAIFPLTALLLFSRQYAEHRGFSDPATFLSFIRSEANREAVTVCAWGVQGAWAQDPSGNIIHVPAYVPSQVIDTLGAGDVFNAGMIHGLIKDRELEKTLTFACRLAGIKCGMEGFEGLP